MNIIAAFIGAVISISIVFLARRDHISPLVAARWFLVAILVLFVSFFPSVIDYLGHQLGIAYPPIIPVIIALGVAMIKIMVMDIDRQKNKVKLDRLVQRVAMLESMIESQQVVRGNFNKAPTHREQQQESSR